MGELEQLIALVEKKDDPAASLARHVLQELDAVVSRPPCGLAPVVLADVELADQGPNEVVRLSKAGAIEEQGRGFIGMRGGEKPRAFREQERLADPADP